MSIGHRAQNHPQQVKRRGRTRHQLTFDGLADTRLLVNGALADVDDRRTPPDLLAECAALAGVDGFDLDVAASADNTKASTFYSIADNGLDQDWWGRVWCNPPYSACAAWVAKAHREALFCDTIALLLPANRTDQSWWQSLVEPQRLTGLLAVYFLAGRRRFDRPGWLPPIKGDRPPFGLCLLVWKSGRAVS